MGIEPTYEGFADPCLTTWLRRLGVDGGGPSGKRRRAGSRRAGRLAKNGLGWSGKRDLNPRPQPWQGCALPLSYSRSQLRRILAGREAVKVGQPASKALRNRVYDQPRSSPSIASTSKRQGPANGRRAR